MCSSKVIIALSLVAAAAAPAMAFKPADPALQWAHPRPVPSFYSAHGSGVRPLNPYFGPGPVIAGSVSSTFRREVASQLLARQAAQGTDSEAFSIGDIFSTIGHVLGFKREEIELIARQLPQDSEAFSIGDIFSTIGHFLGFKREELELLARQMPQDSEAFSFGDIFSTIGHFLGFKREEVLEMLKRDVPADSEAISFGDVFKAIGGFLGFKREELVELMSRDVQSAHSQPAGKKPHGHKHGHKHHGHKHHGHKHHGGSKHKGSHPAHTTRADADESAAFLNGLEALMRLQRGHGPIRVTRSLTDLD